MRVRASLLALGLVLGACGGADSGDDVGELVEVPDGDGVPTDPALDESDVEDVDPMDVGDPANPPVDEDPVG